MLPSDEEVSRGIRPVVADAEDSSLTPTTTAALEQPEEMPWPDAPEERFPWEMGEEGSPPAPPGTFETLTIEELEEFERFERQRLDRGRRSS